MQQRKDTLRALLPLGILTRKELRELFDENDTSPRDGTLWLWGSRKARNGERNPPGAPRTKALDHDIHALVPGREMVGTDNGVWKL